ncbi:VOC family protein [Microbacterium sp.]|uniref:VOC family protein n=1 Tax=Microbacterium sp. TaxID=51671 RepID=UPI00333FEB72
MQRIIPNLWCDHDAEEAGAFYASVFPDARSVVTGRYPPGDLPEFQRSFAGLPVTVDVTIGDFRFTLINAGPEFPINPSISFLLNFDPVAHGGDAAAEAELDRVWAALAEGGTVLMPLSSYPHSAHYGWVQDRYGMTWQLMLTDPRGEPRPFLIPSLLFGSDAQNRAAEAIRLYTGLFPDSATGTTAPYPEAMGPAVAGALMFGEFMLAGQWFAAMDSGSEQAASFTCGVSFEVRCDDQAEIDRLWEALSAVPEAEQCGWLADRFGVSWQIVPSNVGELLSRPGAYQRMLGMKKLVISDF